MLNESLPGQILNITPKQLIPTLECEFLAVNFEENLFREVKMEIRDDMQRLHKSPNGRFELFLLTTEGSTTSDGSSGLPKSVRHQMVRGLCSSRRFRLGSWTSTPRTVSTECIQTKSTYL